MRLSFALFVMFLVGAINDVSYAAAEKQVEGQVLNRFNEPIPSVLVRIYRESREIGRDTTDGGGTYTVSFEEGGLIDTVRYDRSGYAPGAVEYLSGVRNQTINKTLYEIGSDLSVFEAQETLSTIERIFYIQISEDVGFSAIQKYAEPTIFEMKYPEQMFERVQFLKDLYDFK